MRLFICNSGRSFLCVYVWIMTAPSFIFCSFSSGFMNLKLYLFEVCFPCDLSQRFVFVFLLLSPYKYVFEIRGVRLFQTTVMNLTRNEFFEFLVSSFLVWLCSNSQPKTSNLCAIFSFFFFFLSSQISPWFACPVLVTLRVWPFLDYRRPRGLVAKAGHGMERLRVHLQFSR